ncbi:hypothetical protein Q0V21_08240 [Paenibacillus sp. 11B]|uniref:hypothetical protein n=1 Tax=Paenibacillus sp. 11B TaxID=3060965 RepID=UPI00265198D5|nr:hypothetical protein [Paenibacillus sp. 11B]MDN8588758.1 hypothetical protein [Paenibacillus sp. 11B]
MSNDMVTARTQWAWTEKAESQNPTRSRAGEPIWPQYKTSAPKAWLDQGLIQDASEVVTEGQATLDDYM